MSGNGSEPRAVDASRRRLWVTIALLVGAVIAVDLLAQALDRATGGGEPSGAAGSAYATSSDGLAAFSSLLTHYGYAVDLRRGPLASDPPALGTVFVIEPSVLTAQDAASLTAFVERGGRLVVGGAAPFYLHSLSTDPPRWRPEGARSWTRFDPSLDGLRDVTASGAGSWSSTGRGSAIVGRANDSLVTREQVGEGEILFVADASPLENALIGTSDNAAFALALAGDPSRPVVFPEGVHGYGARRGLAAIPSRWKVALIILGLAALAFVWSRARRFGPPDRRARRLPPARAEYVRALSVGLARAEDGPRVLTTAQQWARARVAERAGLGPGARPEAVGAAATRSFGCTPGEAEALTEPVAGTAGVLELGRAIARVAGGETIGTGEGSARAT